jgi:hypothetical protein
MFVTESPLWRRLRPVFDDYGRQRVFTGAHEDAADSTECGAIGRRKKALATQTSKMRYNGCSWLLRHFVKSARPVADHRHKLPTMIGHSSN